MKHLSVCIALGLTVAAAECRAELVADGSFESPVAPGPGFFLYNPLGTAWTFSGTAGVAASSTSGFFAASTPPDGNQFGFIQASGSFSQTVNLLFDGIYVLSFYEAGRVNTNQTTAFGGNQSYDVLLDTTILHSGATTTSQPFEFVSFMFDALAGSHLLTFQGTTVFADGDNTAFFDAVSLTAVPEPSSLMLLGLGAVGLLGARRRRISVLGNRSPIS